MELFAKSLTLTDLMLFLFNILFIQGMLMVADMTINYAWGITFGFTHIPLLIANSVTGKNLLWSDLLPIADLSSPICSYVSLASSQRPATVAESFCDWIYVPWQVRTDSPTCVVSPVLS